ncbi:MAG TPA: APC family permease [Gemmatimonadaceae bacterium]
MKLRKTLTGTALVFVMFFNVSGGAYATEGLAGSVGPGLALLALLIVPLVWSLPETLIIGELASMLPEEGGYYRWVRRAFGEFWAFQNGWATWLYSLVDMAIYPVLFNQYLRWFFPSLGAESAWLVALAVIWGATAINLRGALPVGRVSVWAGSFVLLGFLALALFAIPHARHAPWTPFANPGTTVRAGLAVGLSTALWNYIGWDNASTVQGEVIDASRSYPRALLVALPLVTLGYFVPLLPALAASDGSKWQDGSWPSIAAHVTGGAGPFIAAWIALGGLVSALALFNALLLSYSRIPLAMAVDGLLPSSLARTDERGTPTRAVLVSAVFYSVFVLVPFGKLVVADVLLYAIALMLEFGALIALRRKEPALRGVFRIPTGVGGVAALAALPAIVLGIVIWLSFNDGDIALPSLVGSAIGLAWGPVLYLLLRRRDRSQ